MTSRDSEVREAIEALKPLVHEVSVQHALGDASETRQAIERLWSAILDAHSSEAALTEGAFKFPGERRTCAKCGTDRDSAHHSIWASNSHNPIPASEAAPHHPGNTYIDANGEAVQACMGDGCYPIGTWQQCPHNPASEAAPVIELSEATEVTRLRSALSWALGRISSYHLTASELLDYEAATALARLTQTRTLGEKK